MRNVRLEQMESYIIAKESVSMTELQNKFSISMNTVRRDTAVLLKRGTIEKIYGGVCALKSEHLTPFDVRNIENPTVKARIGQEAAKLVDSGDIIFLDSGTTTLQMIPHLQSKQNITIITYSLHAIMTALPYPNLTIITLPGQLHRSTSSFTGLEATKFLQYYNVQKAFMAATALSLTNGVCNSSPLEYEIKMTALARSEHSYLLLDNQKFGQTALLTYARLEQFDAIITDARPDASYADALERANTKLILASS
ncbi:MAG TPA: DeoR/GlpR family DNA-binding transcription regulator [Candidatus Limiplasma sp.]|nr:DeoR/GlpR family DNA-binding transcription regulator [Candidatus Limiplasma sp.]